MLDVGISPREQQARHVVDAVKGYLDQTARAHSCAGFDCATCALNRDRYVEAVAEVEKAVPQLTDPDAGCFARAKARGQRTFTLVEQDLTSPSVIAEWVKLNIETAPPEKLHDALETAIAMRSWPDRKQAD